MLVARRGLPALQVLAVTLAAIACAAGSVNVISRYLGHATGRELRRASHNPPAGQGMLPASNRGETLVFGIALAAVATLLLGLMVNWLSAAVAGTSILLLASIGGLERKRRLEYSIVLGGAAGCFPVLVSWSAVTGRLSLQVIVLIIMIFCWAPPRLWTLALESRDDHLADQAPTSASPSASRAADSIRWYSCVMVAATLGLAPYGGLVCTACALALGGWFLAEAHRLRSRAGPACASARIPALLAAARPMGLSGLFLAGLAQLSAAVIAVVLLPRGH